MTTELTEDEIRVLLSALMMSQFYGTDSDVAVGLVYKLTSMSREKD